MMRARLAAIFAGVILLIVLKTGPVMDHSPLTVKLEIANGETVATVTGPKALLQRIEEAAKARRKCELRPTLGGLGYGLVWGDDDRISRTQSMPIIGADGCPDLLRHRYTTPGAYHVKAGLFHSGPTDMPIKDWESEVDVVVDGAPKAADLSLGLPQGDTVFTYQQAIPVTWNLTAGRPLDLSLQLVTVDGSVVDEVMLRGLSYVRPGAQRLGPRNAAYDRVLAQAPVSARIRATLLDQEHPVLVRESEVIHLSAEYIASKDNRPTVALVPDLPHAVRLNHLTFLPRCHDYLIDWGDGSSFDRAPPAAGEPCLLEKTRIETGHVYGKAGSYEIRIRTMNTGAVCRPLPVRISRR